MDSRSVLPVELFEEIIDNLDPTSSQDGAALCALSLSNDSLSAMCQRRLFSQVTLSLNTYRDQTILLFENEETTCQKFLHLLLHSPHLISYVQTIVISLKVSILSSNPIDRSCVISRNPEFALYSIIPLLKDLRGFSVKARNWSLPWSCLEPEVKGFLARLASRLEEVDLHPFFGIPTSVFSHSTALKKLQVSRLCVKAPHAIAPIGARAKLRSFHITGSLMPNPGDIVSWFDPACKHALDVEDLLYLKITTQDGPALRKILALPLRNLESLDFQFGDWSYGALPPALLMLLSEDNLLTAMKMTGKSKFIYGSDEPAFQSLPPPIDLSAFLNIRLLTIRTIIRHDPFTSFGLYYESDIPLISSIIKALPRHIVSAVQFTTVVIEIRDVADDLLSSIAWSKLVGQLVDSAADGLTLHLELPVFFDDVRQHEASKLLHSIWRQEDYLREVESKGLVQVSF